MIIAAVTIGFRVVVVVIVAVGTGITVFSYPKAGYYGVPGSFSITYVVFS